MRKYKYFFCVLFLLILSSGNKSSAKLKQVEIHLFGIATSFNDSTVYITDMEILDSAYIDDKTNFLYGRENYSYQLREYLKTVGMSAPTCVTIYAKSKKDIEKKYFNLRKKFIKSSSYNISYLKTDSFRYTAITPDENEMTTIDKARKKKTTQKLSKGVVPSPSNEKNNEYGSK